MKRIVVAIPQFNEKHRHAICEAADHEGYEVLFFENPGDALDAVQDAEILFTSFPELPKAALHLRWLCVPSAGVNPYLLPGAFAVPDVILTSSSGAYGVTIAEHIVMVTLEIMRRQSEYNRIVDQRGWKRDLPIRSIFGSRIVMLGTGNIAQETAKRLRAFSPERIIGVNRSGNDPGPSFDRVFPQERLDEVLPEADLLIISVPGTAETRHMIDARRLALLPDGAILVNVGRGAVLDQNALEPHLRAGRLYAALDVFEQEPIPADASLWECPSLLITPHVAGNMMLAYTVDRILALFLENFENYCSGRPMKRQIDFKKGY